MTYLQNILRSLITAGKGMKLTLQHLFSSRHSRNRKSIADAGYFDGEKGTFTVQYPKEEIPIPDNGRYQLHNEIDDCIVCDKCAKICPVNCIEIEPIRATETYGHTSDGTPLRIYPAKFDIDMAKCCFCGLCTVVCPTECLTMTDAFDYSTSNVADHNFSFSTMTEQDILTKKKEFEDYLQGKAKMPAIEKKGAKSAAPKPVFKPKPIPKKK